MTTLENENRIYEFRVRDRISALTHFIGCIAAILAMPMLLIHAACRGATAAEMASCAVFMIGMILLYGASTSYHSFYSTPRVNDFLKKLDHMSIFILIAASYTPVCVIALKGMTGLVMLAVIWSIALAGMVFKLFFVYCPRWVSSVLYTAMGWACIFIVPAIFRAVGPAGFLWLLAGGLLYSAGAVIYARKRQLVRHPEFGNHEIFHCFVLAGSLCHYIFVLFFLL